MPTQDQRCCLRCDEMFASSHMGNRICDKCKKNRGKGTPYAVQVLPSYKGNTVQVRPLENKEENDDT